MIRCLSGCLLLLILSLLTVCCQPGNNPEYAIETDQGRVLVALEKEENTNYLKSYVDDTIRSSWPLRYPVFRYLKGDVNNDGQDDLAVGVIKRTRYDSVVRKRLFLFQVRNKAIIPLWLGSALGHPLEDFTIRTLDDSLTVVQAIEKEKSERYLVAEYEWFGFGLSFRKYLAREISREDAQALLDP